MEHKEWKLTKYQKINWKKRNAVTLQNTSENYYYIHCLLEKVFAAYSTMCNVNRKYVISKYSLMKVL